MPKNRRGPALFELLVKGGRSSVFRSTARERVVPPEGPALRLARVDAVSDPTRTPSPTSAFSIDRDRVTLSLGSVGAAGAVFGLLVIAGAAFWFGLRSGDQHGFRRGFETARAGVDSPPTDDVQAAKSQPPVTALIAPLLVDPSGGPAKPGVKREPAADQGAKSTALTPAKGWTRDLTYVVAQEFPAAATEKAQDAQRFLAQHGLETAVVPAAGGALLLITTQGYNHKEPAQRTLADQGLAKVRTLGGQYYAAGGGYRLEGYYKTLKRDRW